MGSMSDSFPVLPRKTWKRNLVGLKQWDKTIDQYAAEFLRLSRFTPYMVEEEENQASRFQQGLRIDVNENLMTLQLKIYCNAPKIYIPAAI